MATEHSWQDPNAELSKHYSLRRVPSTFKSHTCDKRLQPNDAAILLRGDSRDKREARTDPLFRGSSNRLLD